jgi:hypothetical protein
VLITDLKMPNPGDGFTVISVMWHSQPKCADYIGQRLPRRAERHAAILLKGEEIIVKAFKIARPHPGQNAYPQAACPRKVWVRYYTLRPDCHPRVIAAQQNHKTER